MSKPQAALPVKAFMSIIAGNAEMISELVRLLIKEGKNIDVISELFAFSHTDYYEKEMGASLVRRFVAFDRLISPDDIIDIKHYAYCLEGRYKDSNGRRKVNLDPGYIAPEKIILSTFKNFSHRIYLGKGVYADITLIYRGGEFKSLEWTFPDYREPTMQSCLISVRKRYMLQLRNARQTV